MNPRVSDLHSRGLITSSGTKHTHTYIQNNNNNKQANVILTFTHVYLSIRVDDKQLILSNPTITRFEIFKQ